jgi:hypothetical protein
MRPKVEQIVSALGDILPAARQKVERQLGEIEAEWNALESIPLGAASSASETLTNAKQKHAELDKTLGVDNLVHKSTRCRIQMLPGQPCVAAIVTGR